MRLASESQVQSVFTTIRNWLKFRSDMYFYVVIPKNMNKTGLKLPPKTSLIELEESFSGFSAVFYDLQTTVPADFYKLFSQRIGKYPVDVVITGRTNAGALIRRQLWDFRFKDTIPVIIDEEMAVNPEALPAELNVSEADMINRTLSYASCYNVFDTELEMRNALITARKYLSGAMLKRIRDRSYVIPPGVDTDWIDEHIAYGSPKNGKFTLFFGGRLNDSKRAKQLVEVYDKMYAAGRDIRIILCSPKQDDSFKERYIEAEGRTEIELYNNLPPIEFYQKAAASHVYLASSKREGFSIGFLEQIYMSKYGLVPILPDLPWTRALLPIDKYKLVYTNFDEAAAMARWIYDNYEQAVQESKWLSDFVKENYNTLKTTGEYLKLLEKLVREYKDYQRLYTKGNVALIKTVADRMKSPFSLDDIYRAIEKYADASVFEPVRGKASKYVVYKWLVEEGGYGDTFSTPVPLLTRKKSRMKQIWL